jgi:hypothetical protein
VIRTIGVIVPALLTITATGAAQLSGTFINWRDHPAIAYATTSTADPVSRLNREIQAGRVELKGRPAGLFSVFVKPLPA